MLQSARVYTHTKKVKDPTFQLDSRLFEYITRRGEADQRHKPYYGRSGSAPQKLMGCCPMERVRFPFAEQSQMPAGHSEPPVAPTTTSPAGNDPPTGSHTTVASLSSRSCASSSLLAHLCRSSKLHCGFDVGSSSPLKALRLDGTAAQGCTGPIDTQQGPPSAARIKGIELVRSLFRAAVGTSSKERRVLLAASPHLRRQECTSSPLSPSSDGNRREAIEAQFTLLEDTATGQRDRP